MPYLEHECQWKECGDSIVADDGMELETGLLAIKSVIGGYILMEVYLCPRHWDILNVERDLSGESRIPDEEWARLLEEEGLDES